MRVVGYARVSSEQQAERGVSVEAQVAKIRMHAELHDLELVGVEVDAGESAGTLDRPGLQRALALLRARGGAEGILVAKLDRLTRSTGDLDALLRGPLRRRALLSVSEHVDTRSAAGLMVLEMMTVAGQWERRAIGERTRAALAHLRARGRWVGGRVEYGWSLEVDPDRTAPDGRTHYRMVPCAAEQAVLERARELRASGLSLREVASALDCAGARARCGRPFAPQTLARVLARAGELGTDLEAVGVRHAPFVRTISD